MGLWFVPMAEGQCSIELCLRWLMSGRFETLAEVHVPLIGGRACETIHGSALARLLY